MTCSVTSAGHSTPKSLLPNLWHIKMPRTDSYYSGWYRRSAFSPPVSAKPRSRLHRSSCEIKSAIYDTWRFAFLAFTWLYSFLRYEIARFMHDTCILLDFAHILKDRNLIEIFARDTKTLMLFFLNLRLDEHGHNRATLRFRFIFLSPN